MRQNPATLGEVGLMLLLAVDDGFLPNFWRDSLTLGGVVFTLMGRAYTIYQVRKTKSAAEAAERAAKEALAESRENYRRFAAANAHRFFSEARGHVDRQEWTPASRRIGDLADIVAQLASVDSSWAPFTATLRAFPEVAGLIARNQRKNLSVRKWSELCLRFQTKLDEAYGPFSSPAEETTDDRVE